MPLDAAKLQANARAAASSMVNGTRSAVSSLVEKGKAAITTNSEQCPICDQRFPYVSQLIAHVNRAHPDVDTGARPPRGPASASLSSTGANEICPQCRAVFPDVTALISHVETAHSTQQISAQASSGSRGAANRDEKCSLM
ncbi:hypothetical protein P43SY_008461 [Pythium insidiosum]|uniref:C2H2-type domain-containing protein n=1 Tax=Pythium insidiosum TaxID=114742 RepID=A0AAD5MBZ3_PYTIN|nr:hypothetical protein P43SY_008461 [Pythium insidiosum]